jgi:hypothetical protein
MKRIPTRREYKTLGAMLAPRKHAAVIVDSACLRSASMAPDKCSISIRTILNLDEFVTKE